MESFTDMIKWKLLLFHEGEGGEEYVGGVPMWDFFHEHTPHCILPTAVFEVVWCVGLSEQP